LSLASCSESRAFCCSCARRRSVSERANRSPIPGLPTGRHVPGPRGR
jgi:hypothetical protein